MIAEPALKIIQNACLNIDFIEGIILHSNLGNKYISDLFKSYLSKAKIKHSPGCKGYPYNNACIELFHSLLKKEQVIFELTLIPKILMIASLDIRNLSITEKGLIVV